MGLRAASWLLLLVGLVGGTWLDTRLPRSEPERRGPYRVLEGDFHVHAFPGDGWLTPLGLIHEARRRRLDTFALTNHNQTLTARWARRLSGALNGPVVLIGEEVTAPDYHFAAVGLQRTVGWRQPAAAAIEEIRSQGGVAIAAHPVARFLPVLESVRSELDGAERMHPLVYFNEIEAEHLRRFFREADDNLTAIGSSDYHFFNLLGACRTLVFARSPDEAAVLEALRAGRTVVVDEAGRMHGDPAMIALLEQQPLESSPIDYAYRGTGSVDRVTRTLGWLGLVGLIVAARRDGEERAGL